MRRPVSGRDAVRSQVIDVLEAQIKRRPAMKKVSTAATKQSRNISQQKLTIGLDRGEPQERRSAGCADAGAAGPDRSAAAVSGEAPQRAGASGPDDDSGASWLGACAHWSGQHGSRIKQELRRTIARL